MHPFPVPPLDAVEGGWSWTVPDGWQQGRGAWGGLVVSAIIQAARQAGSTRPVRSVSVQMLGPVLPGPVRVEVEILRQGSATSSYAVRLRDDHAVLTNATVVTGDARVPDLDMRWLGLEPPDVASWSSVDVVPLSAPLAPVFAQHLEWRPISGWPTSGTDSLTLGWVRPLQLEAHSEATVLGLVDSWWPTTLVRVSSVRPMATMTFEASLVADPALLDPAEPLLHRGRTIAGREGFVVETRELWSASGDLVVMNVQTIVVIA